MMRKLYLWIFDFLFSAAIHRWMIFAMISLLIHWNETASGAEKFHVHGQTHLRDQLAPLAIRTNNEYEQFELYERSVVNISALVMLNDYDIFKAWTDCINGVSQNWAKNRNCGDNLQVKFLQLLIRVDHPITKYVRDADPQSPFRFLPDCSYTVEVKSNLKESRNGFSFLIRQSSCKSDFLSSAKSVFAALPLGGASFFVVAEDGFQQVSCGVRDLFDGSYVAQCPLPRPPTSSPSHPHHHPRTDEIGRHRPVRLRVVLDYEHFDAFSEAFGTRLPLDFTVFDEEVMLPDAAATTELDAVEAELPGAANILDRYRHVGGGWIRRTVPPEVAEALLRADNRTGAAVPQSLRDLYGYSWSGAGNSFPSKSTFSDLFANTLHQSSSLCGESHMRYNWDLIFRLYYGGERLAQFDRKHGYSRSIPGLLLESALFAGDVAWRLDSVNCLPPTPRSRSDQAAEQPPVSMVLQTGAWDLTYAPLRHFLRSTEAAQAMIRSLRNRIGRRCGGEARGRFIWATIVPFPRCDRSLPCHEQGKGFRNNYVIAAANSWIQQQLVDMKADNIFVVNLDSIVKPRLLDTTPVCNNHFLCHDSGPDMLTTPAGLAVIGEILSCLMAVAGRGAGTPDCYRALDLATPLDGEGGRRRSRPAAANGRLASVRLGRDGDSLRLIEGDVVKAVLAADAPIAATWPLVSSAELLQCPSLV